MKKSNVFKKIVLFGTVLGLSTGLFASQKVDATVKTAGEIDGNPYVMTRSTATEPAYKAFTMEQFMNAAPNWFSGAKATTVKSFKVHFFKKPHKIHYTANVNLFASQTYPGQNPHSGTYVGTTTYKTGTATLMDIPMTLAQQAGL